MQRDYPLALPFGVMSEQAGLSRVECVNVSGAPFGALPPDLYQLFDPIQERFRIRRLVCDIDARISEPPPRQ